MTTVPTTLPVAVNGALGRMGQRILALMADDPALSCVLASDRHDAQDLGRVPTPQPLGWPGETPLRTLAVPTPGEVDPAGARVLIDFSLPGALPDVAAWCAHHRIALVCGTTGLEAAQIARLQELAAVAPVMHATNYSLGVALLTALTRLAAAKLPAGTPDAPGYDIEIVEAHHRAKRDAPSGTAKTLAAAAAEGRDWEYPACMQPHQPLASDGRLHGVIGVQALRGGDIVGDHTVMFAGAGEVVQLQHRATSRDVFVHGALTAAKWLVHQPPGLYRVADMLFPEGS